MSAMLLDEFGPGLWTAEGPVQIAHGDPARVGGAAFVRRAFGWLLWSGPGR